MAPEMGGGRGLQNRPEEGQKAVLQPRDVPVPLGRQVARGSLVQLRPGRQLRAVHAHEGIRRIRAHGFRRVRSPGGKLRGEDGYAARAVDRQERREHDRAAQASGLHVRLGQNGLHHRPRVLPVDAVALLADAEERPRGEAPRERELVPQGPDRARARAMPGRKVRTLRNRSHSKAADAVVLEDHQLRRQAHRQPRRSRLAGEDQDDAAQLDRPQRRHGSAVRDRRPRGTVEDFHDPRRHPLRVHVRRARAGASARGADHAQGALGSGESVPRAGRVQDRAPTYRPQQRQDGRRDRRVRDQSRDRRTRADLDRRLRVGPLRHRRGLRRRP